MGITNVLDGKVIDNECKHDGAPFVAPEPGGGGCVILVELGKAVLEVFVGKDACLGETVHATAHFKVDPRVRAILLSLYLLMNSWGVLASLMQTYFGQSSGVFR